MGIDIDSTLIQDANRTLEAKKDKKQKTLQAMKAFPISFKIALGPIPISNNPFPDNVTFIAGNYLEYQNDEKYDCITW